jgi:hypothetical protein
VGSSTEDFERWLKGVWSISLYGSSVKGTWKEGSLVGDPEGLVEKALETGTCCYRGPTGKPGRGSSTRDFERWMKGALKIKGFSLKRLSAEGPWGGLLYWEPWVMKGRLWGWTSHFMRAQLDNLEWADLPRTLRDG